VLRLQQLEVGARHGRDAIELGDERRILGPRQRAALLLLAVAVVVIRHLPFG
jgi:hypothetical protein